MRIAAIASLVAAAAASVAAAQSSGVGQLFISPAGEPFRAGFDQPYPTKTWFDQADANHDGKLTKDEFRADHMRVFRLFDFNKNGVLDDVDFNIYEQRVAPEILTRAFTAPPQKTKPHEMNLANGTRVIASHQAIKEGQMRAGAGYFGYLDEPQPLRAADWDFNYKVDEAEWTAAADRRFSKLAGNVGYIAFGALPGVPFDFLRDR